MLSSESPNSLPEKTSPCHNESGFTLLEIIAVIVILSILAVVAVPKYFDLQEQARLKTLKTAVAEGVGRVNGYFAQQVLSGQSPSQIRYTESTLGSDLGDFTLSVDANGSNPAATNFRITIQGKTGTALAGYSDGRVVLKPGF